MNLPITLMKKQV